MTGILFDLIILMLCMAVGAIGGGVAVRWHEKDKARAVMVEARKADAWRTRCEEARLLAAEQRYPVLGSTLVEPPAPMQFGETEEAELRKSGAFVRSRGI